MSLEDNKALVQRAADLFDGYETDAFDEVYSPELAEAFRNILLSQRCARPCGPLSNGPAPIVSNRETDRMKCDLLRRWVTVDLPSAAEMA